MPFALPVMVHCAAEKRRRRMRGRTSRKAAVSPVRFFLSITVLSIPVKLVSDGVNDWTRLPREKEK